MMPPEEADMERMIEAILSVAVVIIVLWVAISLFTLF